MRSSDPGPFPKQLRAGIRTTCRRPESACVAPLLSDRFPLPPKRPSCRASLPTSSRGRARGHWRAHLGHGAPRIVNAGDLWLACYRPARRQGDTVEGLRAELRWPGCSCGAASRRS